MKKIAVLLMAGIFAFLCFPASALGADGPEHQISLSVTFVKNAVLSTYDVQMYLDDELVAKIPHGTGYSGTLPIRSGTHFLCFRKDGDSSVDGSFPFTVSSDMTLTCSIQAKNNKILITETDFAITGETDPENPFGWLINTAVDDIVEVNGNNQLNLMIRFKKNTLLSKYNVNVYFDDVFLTTMKHGEDYHALLGVSKGAHVLSVQNANDPTVKGVGQFNVADNTFYSCEIEARHFEVKINQEEIGTGTDAAPMSESDYIAACKKLSYDNAARYPEEYKWLGVQVSGRVVQAVEGWFRVGFLLLQDSGGHYWLAQYARDSDEARIIEGDIITVYGKYLGTKVYTLFKEGTLTVPTIAAEYFSGTR